MGSGLISPAVARRIDRASRAAHRFHRFAHHPLCGRYAGEVVTVGRARVCRGCALSLLGVGAGLVAAAAVHSASVGASAVALAAGLAVAGTLTRLPKSLGRFALGLLLGVALGSAVLPAAVALAVGAGVLLAYRRRGPDRSACASCPERTARVCSGFRPMVRRERAFQRLSRRWLDRPVAAAPSTTGARAGVKP